MKRSRDIIGSQIPQAEASHPVGLTLSGEITGLQYATAGLQGPVLVEEKHKLKGLRARNPKKLMAWLS
jgi:hypothetical protein